MSTGIRRILTAKVIAVVVVGLAALVAVVAFRRAQAPVQPPPGVPPQPTPTA